MIEEFNKKIEVKIHKKTLSDEEAEEIIELIKTENVHTILSKLSTTLIRDYLNLAIKSDHIFLFTCKTEKNFRTYLWCNYLSRTSHANCPSIIWIFCW